MTFSPLDSYLFAPLFADEAITAVFSDSHFIKTMVHVEAALAKVQGELGVIPNDAAKTIYEKAATLKIDPLLMQADVDALQQVEDVGPVVAQNIRHFFDQENNREVVDKLIRTGINWPAIEVSQQPKTLDGRTFVITGTLDGYSRDQAARLLSDAHPAADRAVSMAKLQAAAAVQSVAAEILQLHGGYGQIEEHPVPRYYRDVAGFSIGAGTSEIMREIISRSLDVKEVG